MAEGDARLPRHLPESRDRGRAAAGLAGNSHANATARRIAATAIGTSTGASGEMGPGGSVRAVSAFEGWVMRARPAVRRGGDGLLLNLPAVEVKTFPHMSARSLAPHLDPSARPGCPCGRWSAWPSRARSTSQSNLLGHSITWGEAISDSLEDWYVYGALSIPVDGLARRAVRRSADARWLTAASTWAPRSCSRSVYVVLRALVGEVDSLLRRRVGDIRRDLPPAARPDASPTTS